MGYSFFDGADDIGWLYDAHMAKVITREEAARIVCAELFGNEDCPERVELYASRHVDDAPFLTLLRDPDGQDLMRS